MGINYDSPEGRTLLAVERSADSAMEARHVQRAILDELRSIRCLLAQVALRDGSAILCEHCKAVHS